MEETITDKANVLASKEDISGLNVKMKELEAKIAESKADLLKWIIVLFMPFYLGLIAFLVKYFIH